MVKMGLSSVLALGVRVHCPRETCEGIFQLTLHELRVTSADDLASQLPGAHSTQWEQVHSLASLSRELVRSNRTFYVHCRRFWDLWNRECERLPRRESKLDASASRRASRNCALFTPTVGVLLKCAVLRFCRGRSSITCALFSV
jgi:hypothetical protein